MRRLHVHRAALRLPPRRASPRRSHYTNTAARPHQLIKIIPGAPSASEYIQQTFYHLESSASACACTLCSALIQPKKIQKIHNHTLRNTQASRVHSTNIQPLEAQVNSTQTQHNTTSFLQNASQTLVNNSAHPRVSQAWRFPQPPRTRSPSLPL
jgi:hypothetical protein